MKTYTVRDLMVPLNEYATVSEGSTLFEAVLALEKAQEAFDHNHYHHRAILILNKQNKVVGKLSQVDILRALGPGHEQFKDIEALNLMGFSSRLVRNLYKHQRLKETPLKELCIQAIHLKVENFMQPFVEGQYIDQASTLEVAIQQLVMENHLSLLATQDKDIVGVLRLTDVFAAISHTMKECESTL